MRGHNLKEHWRKVSFENQSINAQKNHIVTDKKTIAKEKPLPPLEKCVEEREKREPEFKNSCEQEKEKLKNITKKKKRKKTVNDIHLKIKKYYESGNIKLAKNTLLKALGDNYRGKRLDKWAEILLSLPKEDEEEGDKEDMVNVPDLPLEDLELEEVQVQDNSVQDESGGSITYGVLGAGQGGGRLAASLYKLGYKKCIVLNTARHDLNGLTEVPEEQKFLMDTGDGGGAGKDMQKAEETADKYRQEIYEKMQQLFGNVERIMICICGGGGSGGGSALVLHEVAQKYLAYLGHENVLSRVGFLVTLPKSGECASPKVAENTKKVIVKLCQLATKKYISPLIIFDNDKIDKMYKGKLTAKQFWPTVNSTVTGLFHTFNVLSAQDSEFTSFDPADYSNILNSGGCMIFGLTTLTKFDDPVDVSNAIKKNLENTLLCSGFDISTAKSAACIAMASERILNEVPGLMENLDAGFDTLANLTGNASIFRGIYQGEKDKLVIYTMISGLSSPDKRIAELSRFQETNKVISSSSKKKSLYD